MSDLLAEGKLPHLMDIRGPDCQMARLELVQGEVFRGERFAGQTVRYFRYAPGMEQKLRREVDSGAEG